MYIRRYKAESANMFAGVFSAVIIGSQNISPPNVRTAAKARVVIIDVDTAVFMRTCSFAPKSWDMTTAQPPFMPLAIWINSIVTG